MNIFKPEILLSYDGTFKVNETSLYDVITKDNIDEYIFFELLEYNPYSEPSYIIPSTLVTTIVIEPKDEFKDNFDYTTTVEKDGSYNYVKFLLPLSDTEEIYWNDGIYKNGEKVELTPTLINEIEGAVQIPFFSTVFINQCLIKKQQEMLPIYLNCSTKEDKLMRDLLLDGVYILEYLLHTNNQLEAQSLIERLATCKNKCNCG